MFVTIVAVLAGIAFGVAPALQVSGVNLVEVTQEARVRRQRGRAALVVAEVALSLILLAGAGLMLRSFVKLQNLDLGFESANVLTAQIFLPESVSGRSRAVSAPCAGLTPQLSKPAAFYVQLMETLAATPGLESIGAVSSLPLNPVGIDYDLPVIVEGRPRPRAGEEPQADFRFATPDYFRTMRIALIRGRLSPSSTAQTPRLCVIINDTMARQMFPGEDPLGKRVMLYGQPREIVGVVSSVKHHGFSRDARPEMVVPNRQFQLGGMTIVARSSLEPSVLGATITRAVHAIDPELPVSRVRTMEEFLSASVAQPRFTAHAAGGFCAAGHIAGPRRRLRRDVVRGESAHA